MSERTLLILGIVIFLIIATISFLSSQAFKEFAMTQKELEHDSKKGFLSKIFDAFLGK